MTDDEIYKLGFQEEYLKALFGEDIFKAFEKFMYGQTISCIDGKTIYYTKDVQAFVKLHHLDYPFILMTDVNQP